MRGVNKDKAFPIIIRKITALEGKIKDIEDALVETIVDTVVAPKPKDGESIKGDTGDKGSTGADGIRGREGRSGINGINGISIIGEKGKDGVGLENVRINDSGELIITRSDKKEINVGVVRGKDGEVVIRTVHTNNGVGGSDRPYIQQQISASAVTISGEDYLSLSGQALTANAIILSGSNVTGILPTTKGGTNLSTYTLGDTLYSSATNTLAKLAGNITTTKKFNTQTGTGTVSAAPVWGVISDTDITFTDNTTGNASTVAHGYLPKLPGGTTLFLREDGTFSPLQSSVVVSDNYTVLSTDVYIECDVSGKTITMPNVTLAANQRKFFNIDNLSSGTITIATTSSQTINGTQPQPLLSGANVTLVASGAGTEWRIK